MNTNIHEQLLRLKEAEGSKAEFLRFIVNGCVAAGMHYGVYLIGLLLIDWLLPTTTEPLLGHLTTGSYVVGYLVSFVVNFYLTCLFTFRKQPSWQLFIGFSGSHVVNFLLHVVLFRLCMWVGVHRLLAPFVVMGIAMLVLFTILRFVFHRK